MCIAQEWRSTGDKPSLVARIVKNQKELLKGRSAIETLIQCKVGPKLGEDGPAAELRDFYRDNYQALDRFDRAWYEMCFLPGARDWLSYYSWSLLHTSVINARTIWCAAHGRRVAVKEFLRLLVSNYIDSLTP